MPSHEGAALPQRHILCMKWGTKYGPDYVNRLYAMVRRHLSGEFNFVCLTDDPKGIRSEVQCLPIPPLDLALAPGQADRAWKKLTTFEENLYGLRGRALFIDLDVVIVGNSMPSSSIQASSSSSMTTPAPGADGASRAILRSTASRSAHIRTCWRISARTWTRCRPGTGTSRPTCRPSCTARARWPTGRPNGAQASSTTASRPGPPTTGASLRAGRGAHHGLPRGMQSARCLAGRRNRRFRFIRPARWITQFWNA